MPDSPGPRLSEEGGNAMLFEILDPVKLDGRTICESFRINIVSEVRQMRCKIMFPPGPQWPTSHLVDLVILEYSNPQIDGLGMSISFRGNEMETGTSFEAKIRFELIKKECRFKGRVGAKPFSFECNTILGVIEKVGELIPSNIKGNASIQVVPTNQIQIRR